MSFKQPSWTEVRHQAPTPTAPPRVVAFPLFVNRQLIVRLVDRFLAIPPSNERPNIWRKRELGQLERKRRAQGIAPEIVQRELKKVEQAVAERLAVIFEEGGGAA